MALISNRFFLRRDRMLDFLNRIEGMADPSAVSIYMPPGLSLTEIEDLLITTEVQALPGELSQLAAGSKNGAALFWGGTRKCLVLPPFPCQEKTVSAGYVTEPLRRRLARDFMIGLVLVHLGSYAVGVCRGEKLIASKVGTGLVHGRHKKGGSSQQRFQRRRENQIHEFLGRVCLHAREQIEPHSRLLDYMVYGGPHQTILLLRKMCPLLQSFEDRVLTILDVPSLRQKVLEAAVSRTWSSCVIDWQEECCQNRTPEAKP
ncbi:Vms1/Ankzf1 family peptidyl-tRNA hydrolase [Chloroflexota bacterium]